MGVSGDTSHCYLLLVSTIHQYHLLYFFLAVCCKTEYFLHLKNLHFDNFFEYIPGVKDSLNHTVRLEDHLLVLRKLIGYKIQT